MKQEEEKYFTLADVINIALTKPENSDEHKGEVRDSDISQNVISDFTYMNIWNSFVKWCADQTELGFVVEIYQFCEMFYVAEKPLEGILFKLSNFFVQENNIQFDEKASAYDKHYKMKFAFNDPNIQKINYIAISRELNSKKILVQNGLNNLFKAIGYLLQNNPSCHIDLGLLGSLVSDNKNVVQVPNKIKADNMSNKKTTIKSLINRCKPSEMLNINQTDRNTNKAKNEEQKENKDLPKSRISFKFTSKTESKFEERKNEVVTIPIPMPNKNWVLKNMLNATFKRVYIPKTTENPVLFNVYTHTKAAPFTAEKVQIPISHRIGSFYTLSLQNFIIDKTRKSIQKLNDDYFYRYKTIKFEEPATELEEYLYILHYDNIDEHKIQLKKETYKRYQDFIHNSISDSYIAEMKTDWLLKIVKMANRPYNMKSYDSLLNTCINEITNDYRISMKTSILDYLLKHPEQREKLNIPIQFRKIKEYAEEKVVRPSDGDLEWKTSWNRNKLTISNNLYIMCENVTKILKYFVKNLKDTSYIDINLKDNSWPTLKLNNFAENQKTKLEAEKQIVNEEWRKYVENILKENKIYKDQLILYFKSVSGLMSSQLRKLIIGSIEQYYNYMKLFKKDKYYSAKEIFDNQFDPKQPFQRSFIEVDIKEHPDGDKYTFSDELNDIHAKLTNVVRDIIKYSQGVERPDNMFIKNVDKHSNLWQVPFIDSVVTEMYTEIDSIINENLEVISKVTDLYEPFEFVIKEKDQIKEFLAKSPSRDDFRKRIASYEQKLKLLETMPNNLYMNLIKINCSEINNTIRTKLDECINELLKSIQSTNILAKSKFLGEECEKLFAQFEIQISDEKVLYDLENIFETCKSETVPHLFNEYDDFLEWLFFYLSYDTYNVFETVKDNNTFEQSIKNCHDYFNRIEKSMKSYNDELEGTKKKFTNALDQERAKLLDDVTQLKAKVDDARENVKMRVMGGDETTYTFLKEIEKYNSDALECKSRLEVVVTKEGYLGSAFQTEDERIDQCIIDLEPMINYFSFINKFKSMYKEHRDDFIWSLKFSDFDELINNNDLFDVSMQKIPSYKDRIARAKNDFEEFKATIEISKMIYPLVEVFKNADEEEDELLLDNQFYCQEAVKYFPQVFNKETPKETQNEFLNLKFINIQKYKKILEQNKENIEKVIEEWQNVFQMHILKDKMKKEINAEFVLEKYNKKEFLIIKPENFDELIAMLNKNLELAQEKLNMFEVPRNDIIVVKIFKDFESIVKEVLEVIKKLKDKQNTLEHYMDKTAEIKKKPEAFQILKQAEKEFKNMIDLIIDNQTKIQAVYAEKDKFNGFLSDLTKLFGDIEHSLVE